MIKSLKIVTYVLWLLSCCYMSWYCTMLCNFGTSIWYSWVFLNVYSFQFSLASLKTVKTDLRWEWGQCLTLGVSVDSSLSPGSWWIVNPRVSLQCQGLRACQAHGPPSIERLTEAPRQKHAETPITNAMKVSQEASFHTESRSITKSIPVYNVLISFLGLSIPRLFKWSGSHKSIER